ncbi:hypothetical protein F4802DRAFT_619159 [Xylaria palmicola]|nr:hypothetical protein F4802DRAFT_619159 [Xylaria palmicola]
MSDMANKGLTVTLVLDCSFSGSVLRYNTTSEFSSVRYRKYDTTVQKTLISTPKENVIAVSDDTTAANDDDDGEDRDASMLLNWLVNPEGYTAQNAMWYGNTDLYFFGDGTLSMELTGRSVRRRLERRSVTAPGGQAHGICEGDELAVYTIGSERAQVMGIVKCVRPLTSDIELSEPDRLLWEKCCVEKTLAHMALRRYPVQLSHDPSNPEDWYTAIEERRSLASDNREYPYVFHIVKYMNGQYRIQDGVGRVTDCTPGNLVTEGLAMSPSHVFDVVERLAKLQLVKDLTNTSQDAPFDGREPDPYTQIHIYTLDPSTHTKEKNITRRQATRPATTGTQGKWNAQAADTCVPAGPPHTNNGITSLSAKDVTGIFRREPAS